MWLLDPEFRKARPSPFAWKGAPTWLTLAALWACAPSPAWAEPIVLACIEDPGQSEAAEATRFFVLIDFDDDSVRVHGRDYPPLSVLLVQPWRVEFADSKTSPAYLGSIDRITGELRIEITSLVPEKASGLLEARCELTTRLF